MMGDANQNWVPKTPSAKSLKGNGEVCFVESDQVNETPRKRKKMKRHRPKVLNHDKPKRTPKPKPVRTPKPRTPKPPNEKIREKRKYGHAQESCNQRLPTCKQKLDFNLGHNDGFITADDPGSYFEDFGTGKIVAQVPNTLKTYERRFYPNDCFKNSRRLAPIFPTIFKRTRMKQRKRTNFTNFANDTFLPSSEFLSMRQTRLVMVDRISFGCVLSSVRRTRSKTSVRYRRKNFTSLLMEKCTDAYRQVQDIANPNYAEEDQMEEQDLATNAVDIANPNFTEEDQTEERDLATNEFDIANPNFTGEDKMEEQDLATNEVDIANPNFTEEDKMEEQDLATNEVDIANPNFTEEDQTEEQNLAVNKVDVVSYRRNIINSCPNHSLELIPRKFPPNLEQNYFLTARDDTDILEALISSTITRFASLRVCDKNEGIPTKSKLKKSATATTPIGEIPMEQKKIKSFIDFDRETLEGWSLMRNGTWDWNNIMCFEDGRGSGNNLLVNNIEDAATNMDWNNIMRLEDGHGSGNMLLGHCTENADKNSGGVETDSMKYWKQEIETFSRKIESFICCMSKYLGDRRFSKMKGSVVDSIVGVFLTQNVGDQLSSSAFLSLAAKYPPRPTGTNSRSESTRTDAPRPGQLAHVISTDQHLLTRDQDQILENESGRHILNRDEMISSSTGDGPREQDSYDQILEGGSQTCVHTTNKMAAGFTEDEVIDVDETTCVKCQESVILGDYSSSSFNTLVGFEASNDDNSFSQPSVKTKSGENASSQASVEPSNGDNTCSQSSIKTNSGENASSQSSAEPNKTNNGENASSQSSVEANNGHTDFSSRSKSKKGKVKGKRDIKIDWDELRRTYKSDHDNDETDNVDWEAVRQAPVQDIAEAIAGRGMSNILAKRIKDFLDRVVEEHGSIDLEWLRSVPPDKVKDYLLSYKGLGLKSVECVRLLGLQMVAFPVDVNVARILVRLGWVPLQPLPDDLPFHLLNSYPDLNSVQKYVWPRLSAQSMWILYMFHCYLITCGKVFCTKKEERCYACPMKPVCKHYASKTESSKRHLPGPENGSEPIIEEPSSPEPAVSEIQDLENLGGTSENERILLAVDSFKDLVDLSLATTWSCLPERANGLEPLIEEPSSPEPAVSEIQAMKDFGGTSENERMLLAVRSCKDLVDLSLATASIPMPKLKHKNRLKTIHEVFVLPDSHLLLAGFDERVPEDEYPYILAVWTEGGDAATSSQPSNECDCSTLTTSCGASVAGTILIPYVTAVGGAFPLNGTYFQRNEYFADHETTIKPIHFPKHLLSGLCRARLHCGTSVRSISSGSSAAHIKEQFWGDVMCSRGFDRATRKPEQLSKKFHVCKSRKYRED